MTSFSERLREIIDSKEFGNANKFAKKLGYSSSEKINRLLRNESANPSYDILLNISEKLPDINPEWLLTGKGPMFKNITEFPLGKNHDVEFLPVAEKSTKDLPVSKKNMNIAHVGPTGNEYKDLDNGKYKVSVPLVPAYAHAQYITDYQADELKDRFEYVDFVVDMIGKGKYYAFEIKGDSMDDDSKRSIPDGSTVLARDVKKDYWLDKLHYIKFPYWIIVHQNSILCKQIIDHDVEKGIIRCHSLNDSPEYTDFDIDLRDVKQLLNIVKVQQEIKFL